MSTPSKRIREAWRWLGEVWLWLAAIALLVAYGGFLFFLQQIGAFKFPAEEPAAEVLAAVVGVLGGAFAAILTFFGVLLKHSVDERNLALKQEAEGRLKLETSQEIRCFDECRRHQ